jgi:hypothetical protein
MNPIIKMLSNTRDYFHRMPAVGFNTMSGYKLHIYGECVEDAARIWTAIDPVLFEYNLSAKYGTVALFEHESSQRYKAATVYFHQRANMVHCTLAIMAALEEAGYQAPAHASIHGDVHLNGPVFARFELSEDLGRDVNMDEYDAMYSSAPRCAA